MSALCISGRNQYSKGAIQQDFAQGLRELDQELAAEDDEGNFNPDADTRNYEVARSLPVFCVSSRGYQKLQGRLKKDPDIPSRIQGFGGNRDSSPAGTLQAAHCGWKDVKLQAIYQQLEPTANNFIHMGI